MARVHIVTEGPTEKNFIDDVLKPHLAPMGVYVDAHSVTTRRDRRRNQVYRGGLNQIKHLLTDIRLWLLESQSQMDCYVSTMVDLYAFPYNQREDWTNEISRLRTGVEKAEFLENRLALEFSNFLRFIPYVQVHEFEALLLVDTAAVGRAFIGITPETQLILLNRDIGNLSPEEVNDGQATAPSKRIIHFFPEYGDDKPTWGTLIALEIGIEKMKEACPHFRSWVEKLERLPG